MSTTDFVISHEFGAPRDRVFRAFTEWDGLKEWWGPAGLSLAEGSIDFQPGGVFHYGLKSADGFTMWGKWVFESVNAPESFTSVTSFSDPSQGITRHPMSGKWPLETWSEIRFEAKGDKTLVTVASHPVRASADEIEEFTSNADSMKQGFEGTFAQLDAYLASEEKKS